VARYREPPVSVVFMIELLRAEVKRMFDEAFAPPRPCLAAFFHGVIDTLFSASDKILPVNQKLKKKQRDKLNALLNVESELEGPEMAEAWKIIDHDARWAFEGCFILVGYLSLSLAIDIRLLDMNRLYQRYPRIMDAGAPGSAEAVVLLQYTNVMKTALLSTKPSGRKAMLIDICVRLSEGASAADKYKRGSGPQTTGSTLREIIFERESGTVPKPCREKREVLRLSTALATAGAADNDTPAKRPSPADFETPVRAKQRTTTQPGSISAAGECVLQQVLSSPACEGTSRGAATVSSSIGGITPQQQCVHTLPGREVQPITEDVYDTSGMGCSSETESTHSFHNSDERTIVEDVSDPFRMPWCLSTEASYSIQDSEGRALPGGELQPITEDVYDTSGMGCSSETESAHSFHNSDERAIVEDISDPFRMSWCLSAEASYSIQDSEGRALPGGELQPITEDVYDTSGMGCSSETESTHSLHNSDERAIVEDISDPFRMSWCLSAEPLYSIQDSEGQSIVEDVFDTSAIFFNSDIWSVYRSFREGGYVGDDAERRYLQYSAGVPTAASQDSGVLGSDYVTCNL
jgi:hypothetical protein